MNMSKLIVESGATKTDWRLLSPDGSVVSLQTPGMNWSTIAPEANASVLESASRAFRNVEEVFFYAAGLIGRPAFDLEPYFPGAKVEYASDLLAAARAVCGRRQGVAAILGTGSNSCLYDGERIVKNYHSGGFIIGDEGGAASLGRLFLADFIKDLVPTALAEAFAARFDGDYKAIVTRVYRSETPSRYLGSLAPFLLEYRDEPYVRALVESNLRSFLERSVLRYGPRTVGVVGGFGMACEDILREIGAGYGITFTKILASPMEGLVEYHGV